MHKTVALSWTMALVVEILWAGSFAILLDAGVSNRFAASGMAMPTEAILGKRAMRKAIGVPSGT